MGADASTAAAAVAKSHAPTHPPLPTAAMAAPTLTTPSPRVDQRHERRRRGQHQQRMLPHPSSSPKGRASGEGGCIEVPGRGL